MRLAVTMIVGPGEADRHLERCITHARSWADVVLVYGDAPDPATRALIDQHAHAAWISDEPLFETGEHLVRNRMLQLADDTLDVGDIIVSLDADEQLHATPQRAREILHLLEHNSNESWSVHFHHLWTPDGTMHRVDGQWQPCIAPRVYRHRKGYQITPIHEGSWVCFGLPEHLLRNASRDPLMPALHWSYARERDRAPKHERYSRLPGHSMAHVNSIIEQATLAPVPPCLS